MGRPKAVGIEDEETEEEEDLQAPDKKASRPFQCPECEHEEPDYEKAPAHMERHRPLGKPYYSKKGKLLSIACIKKCGRYFTAGKDIPPEDRGASNNLTIELRVHLAMCDGQPPITKQIEKPKEEERPMPKKTGIPECPYHPELTFTSGQGRGQHLKNHHPDWKADPKLNLKLTIRAKGGEASRNLTLATPAAGGALIPSAAAGDVKSVDDLLSLQNKTAEDVLALSASHRARAQYHATEADNLEVYAKKMKDSMRA